MTNTNLTGKELALHYAKMSVGITVAIGVTEKSSSRTLVGKVYLSRNTQKEIVVLHVPETIENFQVKRTLQRAGINVSGLLFDIRSLPDKKRSHIVSNARADENGKYPPNVYSLYRLTTELTGVLCPFVDKLS